jgi:hypothetical protein
MTHICRIIQMRPITQQVIHMSFIEINTKKQFKLHIHTTVPSAEIKERVKPIFIYFSSCENNELKSYKFNTL